MGKKGKRKTRSADSGSEESVHKTSKTRGPSGGDLSVSELLNWTNSILYDDDNVSTNDSVFGPQRVITEKDRDAECVQDNESKMASTSEPCTQPPRPSTQPTQPTTSDIMSCLKSIEGRLMKMEKRLDALEEVKQKVSGVETDLKKLRLAMEDRCKKMEERLHTVEERVESCDFAGSKLSDRVIELERDKKSLKDDVVYLQAQSMRNNLVFSNIPEARPGTSEDCEEKIRSFLVEKMKIAKETVDSMVLDRVHRIGPRQDGGRCRGIVAKFHEFKDREYVKKQGKALKGTNFYVNEQFPKEISEKRKRLIPKMKEARREGKDAWLAFDTLYVNGRPVRD